MPSAGLVTPGSIYQGDRSDAGVVRMERSDHGTASIDLMVDQSHHGTAASMNLILGSI
jgi:hypothetical protein